MYCYVWEFLVAPEHRPAFEKVYGPEGDWVKLFRGDPSYLRTILLHDRDNPEHFLTMDYWLTEQACLSFRKRSQSELEALDARCASWTQEERFVGDFDVNEGPAGSE